MPRFVLTAAHCLVSNKGHYWILESPWMLAVMAGSTTLWYSPNWQVSNVDSVIPHPFFSFISMVHDIGVLKTSLEFTITPYVSYAPIPMQISQDFFEEYTKGCQVVGWGKTSESSQSSSGTLRHANVPLIPTHKCSQFFSHTLHDGQICAGHKDGGVDACQGDSGGPLICDGMQVGLVSWGQGCAVANSPGVYCRLDYYLDWINETISRSTASSPLLTNLNMLNIIFTVFTIYVYYLI